MYRVVCAPVRDKDYCLAMEFSLGQGLRNLDGPILITGHTGFKGTWLSLLLEKLDVEFVGLSLPPEKGSLFSRLARTDSIPEVFGDIRNLSVVQQTFKKFNPAAVIHMAAQPLVLESYKTPIETFDTNVMGTANVLDTAVRAAKVKGIVSVTTDKVYENLESEKRFVESDPLAGKDPYSASKVGSEAAISAWQQISKMFHGIPISSVRAGNVIGGGDWAENRLMPDLIKGFIDGKRIELRNPESTRPWQHALDPLAGYILTLVELLQSGNDSCYNFGPIEKSLTVRDAAEMASSVWGCVSDVSMSHSRTELKKEAVTLELNPKKAIDILKWAPAWDQKGAITATVEWWRKTVIEEIPVEYACDQDLEHLLRNQHHTG